MEFKELNQKGYELRENEGKHAEALNVFKQALEVAEDFDQRSEAMSQLGLTHWHMKDFDAARKVWSENLTLCEKAGQPGPLALAYRNMGRPEITSDWEKQLEFMKNSFELAEKAGREDAVWFAHGVVAAAIKAEKLDVAKEWSEIEFVELQKHLEGTIEVPNQNNVHIWHTDGCGFN